MKQPPIIVDVEPVHGSHAKKHSREEILKELEDLINTMDSYTRLGVGEYYRKLHTGYWRDRLIKIRRALSEI